MPDTAPRPPYVRLLLGVADVAVTAFVIGAEITRPLYRPAMVAIGHLAPVKTAEAWIGRLPAYAILAILAVPFLGVEPLKVLGVVWIGQGHFLRGLALLAVAYLASFLLVERIYHAGRDRLLTIGWFAACIGFAARVKETLLARVRETRAWRAAVSAGERTRAFARRILDRSGRRVPSA